ncbi:MAG: FabA/FabZ family ACP-dehydratase [Nitrospinae bacterium]|nr:FabA/FabZ family ACP-dehydratase [Nitrospinota bacterium]
MRFLFFDQIKEVVRGERIVGVKTFPLSEAYLSGHFSRAPRVPGSVLIEAMAQITGWLVVYTYDFRTSCVISLIDDAEVTSDLRPGVSVEIHGEMIDTNERASLCRARIEKDGVVVARAERFVYPHFPNDDPEGLKERFRNYGWLAFEETA